jgi:hypothetical protein
MCCFSMISAGRLIRWFSPALTVSGTHIFARHLSKEW